MIKPLDEEYFSWLYSKFRPLDVDKLHLSYFRLCRLMYNKEYLWHVPNDDNRVNDGLDLRYTFLFANHVPSEDAEVWRSMGCSFLEMLVALAYHLEFDTEIPVADWLFELLVNLDLDSCNDESYHFDADDIDLILNRVIFRTYSADGQGGLFPLRSPHRDQRKVEIWYQMSEYLLEKELSEGR